MDPRGFPTSLPEFQRVFPDDASCATYLERLPLPDRHGLSNGVASHSPEQLSANLE